MVDRAYGVKQSDFTAQTSILPGSYLGFFANGYNYKITYDNFLSGLGVTGSIAQDGAVTGTPVLDIQGTVNLIRNLEDGAGIVTNVSAENGITIAHNFTVDTTGEPLMQDIADPSPTFVSLVAGAGINLTTSGTTIEIESEEATKATRGQVSMQGNGTATTIAGTSTPALVAGTWTVYGDNLQMTGTTAGRLTYTGATVQHLRFYAAITIQPSANNNQQISLYLAKNGSVISESRIEANVSHGSVVAMSTSWQNDMSANDYVEVYVQNATSTTTLIVSRAVLSVH